MTNKHPDAVAWERFEAGSPDLFEPGTLDAPEQMRTYLTNRLQRAFNAGMAAERHRQERRVSSIRDVAVRAIEDGTAGGASRWSGGLRRIIEMVNGGIDRGK